MTDECIELKNIKYKTMLVSPETMEVKSKQNIKNIDEIIKRDQAITDKLPWNKLNKTIKLNKLDNYIEEYSISNNINIDEREQLTTLLYDSLNKKLLQKAKDIVYDKECGVIKNIPILVFNKTLKKKFTIKNGEKKISPLRSLAPKKRTAKNKSDKRQKGK
tara:strand:+ start:117 stop:599 length:483 start_codon:yes stop_codon:yes gene_type:complete